MSETADHRILGKELGLFMQHPWAPGAFFWLPAGLTLYQTLSDAMRRLLVSRDYIEVRTPLLFNKELWEKSGHWEKYKEHMFVLENGSETFSLKPMNCPSHMLIYKNGVRSYRDLPIRIHDQGVLHRNEESGALGGLVRTRQFSQDDAHIFLMENQIQEEIHSLLELIKIVYEAFGLAYTARLSTRPKNFIGEGDLWTHAELMLEGSLRLSGQPYTIAEGDGAFYGPKIDFEITDSLDRKWQCATIQLDFILPKRFELEYTGEDNKPHMPVVIHRAIFGSFERFIAILLEHYAGVLPTWLSPEQVRVLNVGEEHLEYALLAGDALAGEGLRVHTDGRTEKLGAKIRDAEIAKVPWVVVVGAEEQAKGTVSLRQRGVGPTGSKTKSEAAVLLVDDAKAPF